MYQNFIIPYLYETQHILGDTQALPDNVHQLHIQEPPTYEKSEAASAVLGS
jgi:hypothetical protein